MTRDVLALPAGADAAELADAMQRTGGAVELVPTGDGQDDAFATHLARLVPGVAHVQVRSSSPGAEQPGRPES